MVLVTFGFIAVSFNIYLVGFPNAQVVVVVVFFLLLLFLTDRDFFPEKRGLME